MKDSINQKLKLSDLVELQSRFGRSVNLEYDFYDNVSLEGYILTTTARSTLLRIANGIADSSSRAWTLTGPYGAGKSAFALFTAKVFESSEREYVNKSRQTIKEKDLRLWRLLFGKKTDSFSPELGLHPVLISGSREPIELALLRGLSISIEHCRSRLPKLEIEVNNWLKTAESGAEVPSQTIIRLYEQAAHEIRESQQACGLFIIIDELGKFLEFAANHPHRSDIFILQQLAQATRKTMRPTLFVLTILHRAFERYAESLGKTQREDWAKVQGRFEDISYQEPLDQILSLTAHAIKHRNNSQNKPLREFGKQLAHQAEEIGLIGANAKTIQVSALADSVPLHPTVSLLLGQVFRRVGQNERSLFAFLTSGEPHSFQYFLQANNWDPKNIKTLRLDNLYDYLIAALGNSLYSQIDGRKWAETEDALNHLESATELEAKIIKAIGLIKIAGEIGSIKSSQAFLEFAFENEKYSAGDVAQAISSLQARSLIVYRQYNETYAIWEGSDVDLQARLEQARKEIEVHEPLVVSLAKYFNPRPIVARRHSQQIGTLRYFEVQFAEPKDIEAVACKSLGSADGRIIYILAQSTDELNKIHKQLTSSFWKEMPLICFATSTISFNLQEAVFRVACWRWIQSHTPELEGDRTARRELQKHLSQAESVVERLLQSIARTTGQTSTPKDLWFRKGEQIQFNSDRAIQEFLSDVCDEVFHSTPRLHNEIINRRQISGSAAAARRELVAAMITNADQAELGITGFPPQLSIYLNILQETTLHRNEQGKWGFYSPSVKSDSGIREVWDAIDRFLTETEVRKRNVTELFDILVRPPFGIKAGVLPILLCCALLYFDTEVALYEEGSFVPSLSVPLFERVIKAPEKFELRRCNVAGVRAKVFEQFAKALIPQSSINQVEKQDLLTIVKPLVQVANSLPNYTRYTQRLSPTTQRVRSVLLEAREPDQLLFQNLPEACGFTAFTLDSEQKDDEISLFFQMLRESLAELQRTYDDLLGELETRLISAFSLKEKGAQARIELIKRSSTLIGLTVEPKLNSLIIRILDDKLDHTKWIESLATLLTNKPPTLWYDADLALYEIKLAELARSFRHLELLSFELNRIDDKYSLDDEIFRFGVTSLREFEREHIVRVSQQEISEVKRAEEAVNKALENSGLNGNSELRLAVLARICRNLLIQIEGRE